MDPTRALPKTHIDDVCVPGRISCALFSIYRTVNWATSVRVRNLLFPHLSWRLRTFLRARKSRDRPLRDPRSHVRRRARVSWRVFSVSKLTGVSSCTVLDVSLYIIIMLTPNSDNVRSKRFHNLTYTFTVTSSNEYYTRAQRTKRTTGASYTTRITY